MKLLFVHNYYQIRGGEDVVFEREVELMKKRGHLVETLTFHNNDITGSAGAARAAVGMFHSQEAVSRLRAGIQKAVPDVIHVHNNFPRIMSAAFKEGVRQNVPVVHTIHNYRFTCIAGTHVRNGVVCTECGTNTTIAGMLHGCYRGSRAASTVVTAARSLSGLRHYDDVTAIVALTGFARQALIDAGVDKRKIYVKPNFAMSRPNPGGPIREGFVYVGRLSPEKGLVGLIGTFSRIGLPLDVFGTGPSEDFLKGQASRNIRFLGKRPESEVRAAMEKAKALIVPSLWYEGFPSVIVEAYAAGLPVIASDIGSLSEVVENDVTGLHFPVGDMTALGELILALDSSRERSERMSRNALNEYRAKYTPEQNGIMAEEIYREAVRKIRLRDPGHRR